MTQKFGKGLEDAKPRSPVNEQQNQGQINLRRRTVIRKLVVGSAALACSSAMPSRWTTPLIEFGTLPAHATTSGAVSAIVQELRQAAEQENVEAQLEPQVQQQVEPQVQQQVEPEVQQQEEMYGYQSREEAENVGPIHISGHFPTRFVFNHKGPTYGRQVLIVCDDGQQMQVNDTSRGFIIGTGNRKYVAGEPYFNHEEGAGKFPTMEYYADYGTRPNRCWVYYNG